VDLYWCWLVIEEVEARGLAYALRACSGALFPGGSGGGAWCDGDVEARGCGGQGSPPSFLKIVRFSATTSASLRAESELQKASSSNILSHWNLKLSVLTLLRQ